MAFRFADVIDYLLPFRGKADPDDPLNFYDLPDDTLSQALQILDDVDGGNRQLSGRRAALTYLNMSRDGQIAGMLALLAGPIISSTWGVESDSEEISAFVEEQLGIGQDPSGRVVFDKVLREALTCLSYGFSLQERVFEVMDGMLTLERLGFRYQTSVKRFITDESGDFLDGVEQIVSFTPEERTVTIPIDNLVYYAPHAIGSTWEGQSVLRGAYKHWFFKSKFYLIDGVAARRFGVPVLVGEYSENTSRKQQEDFAKQLAALASSYRGYLLLPEGDFSVNFLAQADQQRPDLDPSIAHHNEQIVAAMAGQVLSLGTARSASRALGQTLAALFFNALKSYADHVRDTLQARVVLPLIRGNFPGHSARLFYSHLDNSNFSRLVEAMAVLADKGLLTPGEDTEENLRDRLELPKETKPRQPPEPVTGGE